MGRARPGARRCCCRSCPAPPSRSGWTSATSTSASRSATSRASSSAEDWSPAEVDHAPTESLDLAARARAREPARRGHRARPPARRRHGPRGADRQARRASIEADGILPGWHGIRPAAEMQARLGVPVELENDANVGALGEKVFGAARGVDDLIYVRAVRGHRRRARSSRAARTAASRGVAGEIGHVLADPTGPICRCGNRGCLETVAGPVAVAALLERSTGTPVSVRSLLELVAAGDRGAQPGGGRRGRGGRARARRCSSTFSTPSSSSSAATSPPAGAVLLDPIRAAIERHACRPPRRAVRVDRRHARRPRRGPRRGRVSSSRSRPTPWRTRIEK